MRRFRRTLRSRLFLLALTASAATGGCRPGDEIPEHPGKAVYLRHCYACHHAGVAGAPKFGEKNAWTNRLAGGRAALIANVQRGMAPSMPPRGACGTCSDEELTAAVDFMLAAVESSERGPAGRGDSSSPSTVDQSP